MKGGEENIVPRAKFLSEVSVFQLPHVVGKHIISHNARHSTAHTTRNKEFQKSFQVRITLNKRMGTISHLVLSFLGYGDGRTSSISQGKVHVGPFVGNLRGAYSLRSFSTWYIMV